MARKTAINKKKTKKNERCEERLREQSIRIEELEKQLEKLEGEKRFLWNMLVERDSKRWKMKRWWENLLGA